MAHLKMMAATQPFISGAISKTVNLPHDCTVEDIQDAYVQAWKMGLKCVAIYRDGSKRSQPLNTQKTNEGGRGIRRRPPQGTGSRDRQTPGPDRPAPPPPPARHPHRCHS